MVQTIISDMKIAAQIACSMGIDLTHQKLPIVKVDVREEAIRVCAYGGKKRAELIMHDAGKTVLREGPLFEAHGSMITCYPDGRITRHFVYSSSLSDQPVCYRSSGVSDPATTRRRVTSMAAYVLHNLGKLAL